MTPNGLCAVLTLMIWQKAAAFSRPLNRASPECRGTSHALSGATQEKTRGGRFYIARCFRLGGVQSGVLSLGAGAITKALYAAFDLSGSKPRLRDQAEDTRDNNPT